MDWKRVPYHGHECMYKKPKHINKWTALSLHPTKSEIVRDRNCWGEGDHENNNYISFMP